MKDGGPAFPGKTIIAYKVDQDEYESNFSVPQYEHYEGMTLRDYFAARAMQGMLASERPDWVNIDNFGLANRAYSVADIMIKEREI